MPPPTVLWISSGAYETVPHGRPMSPGRTVTFSEEVSSPEVTDTVVVPALYAQNRPEVDDGIGFPDASSSGNNDPGPLGSTNVPIPGIELLNV